ACCAPTRWPSVPAAPPIPDWRRSCVPAGPTGGSVRPGPRLRDAVPGGPGARVAALAPAQAVARVQAPAPVPGLGLASALVPVLALAAALVRVRARPPAPRLWPRAPVTPGEKTGCQAARAPGPHAAPGTALPPEAGLPSAEGGVGCRSSSGLQFLGRHQTDPGISGLLQAVHHPHQRAVLHALVTPQEESGLPVTSGLGLGDIHQLGKGHRLLLDKERAVSLYRDVHRFQWRRRS